MLSRISVNRKLFMRALIGFPNSAFAFFCQKEMGATVDAVSEPVGSRLKSSASPLVFDTSGSSIEINDNAILAQAVCPDYQGASVCGIEA
jgi:hypothetical protein